MPVYRRKGFQIGGILVLMVFVILFLIRLGLFHKHFDESEPVPLPSALSERDTWMNIIQDGRKIGFSHTIFSKIPPNKDRQDGSYRIQETVFMRINTMGMVQDLNLSTDGILNSDFSLSSIAFKIGSGRFQFEAKGVVSGDILSIITNSSGLERKTDIKIRNKPFLVAGIVDAVRSSGMKTGQTFNFDIFDPATMEQETVTIKVIGKEKIQTMGTEKTADKLSLNFKGISQLAWIDSNGDVLKETGFLGISLEKTSRNDALFGLAVESSDDLTKIASVESNLIIENPEKLKRLIVDISGIQLDDIHLEGGRQTLKNNILTIEKESLEELFPSDESVKEFLQPNVFIQSDHPKIRELAKSIAPEGLPPVQRAKKLLDWVYTNIEKRPVLSVPDALSTLENRVGDCNEHSVLFAALARASGIPAQVEGGLVYLKGRFYYHAWNLIYLGKWVSADSLFGQLPADVTHIRLTTGTQQLDLMSVIGKIRLKLIETSE